jgi:Uncharacterized protein with SCP/PR1 domains
MSGGNWKAILAAAVAAFAALAGSADAPSSPTRPAVSLDALSHDVLIDVNAVRKSHGLAPVRLSVRLNAAAAQHSNEMARVGYFAHESANGSAFEKRLARFYPMGSRHYWSVGENLVWAGPDLSADKALELWMSSPPHRENLLTSRWREIGISAVHADSAPGLYGGGPATIITADFGVRR